MSGEIHYTTRLNGARLGMFIADALAMPVHWYYNTWALRMDYGEVRNYLPPRNPHPDSILWRSSYVPVNRAADILHDQAQYWGVRDIHYHQFLKAGENTLNCQLARQLMHQLDAGRYSRENWLTMLIDFLTTPGNHHDTYAEEYLRHFFNRLGQGVVPARCGRNDEKHIGGLALMLPVLLATGRLDRERITAALDHLALTHGGRFMREGARLVAEIVFDVLEGEPLVQSINQRCHSSAAPAYARHHYGQLASFPENVVIGKHFSSACYLDHALPAVFALAVKYSDDPESALIANTMCGGDNSGRGVVLGALLGAALGSECWPERWRRGLLKPPPLLPQGDPAVTD